MRSPLSLASLALALLATTAPAVARPAAGMANPVVTAALPGSGARLYGMQDARLPRVWYHLYLEAGERFVPARLAGMSSAAAEMLERGPADIPYARYKRDLFRRDAEIRWEAGNRFMIAHVKCLPQDLPAVTALVRRTVKQPRADEATFKEVMGLVINQRQAMNDSMSSVTFNYGKQKLWEFRPEARQPEGWTESLGNIKRADLAGFLATRLAHPAAFVATAAPFAPARVAAGLAPALAGWVKPLAAGRASAPKVAMGRRVVLIDKPGATDNQIYALSPLPVALNSREAAAAEVFFAGMGYDLGSRLGKTLRVQRGLTYGANSGVRRVEWPQWYAYSFGGIQQTPKIVSGIFELFHAAGEGLTPAEVATAKSELLQGTAADMESPTQQLDAVAAAVAQGLPASYPFDRPRLIAAVKPAEVKPTARLAAALDHATIIVMGDAKKIRQPVEAALPKGTPLVVRELSELGPEAIKLGGAPSSVKL